MSNRNFLPLYLKIVRAVGSSVIARQNKGHLYLAFQRDAKYLTIDEGLKTSLSILDKPFLAKVPCKSLSSSSSFSPPLEEFLSNFDSVLKMFSPFERFRQKRYPVKKRLIAAEIRAPSYKAIVGLKWREPWSSG